MIHMTDLITKKMSDDIEDTDDTHDRLNNKENV